MELSALRLTPHQLRANVNASAFDFESTAELASHDRVIGQERALRAIDFGISMPAQGYNIYAMGPAGSGRTTAVRRYLAQQGAGRPVPTEWCYVYNFDDPRRPQALDLPAGRAIGLRNEMDELVQQLQQELPRAFEGEFYEQRRREIVLDLQQKQQTLIRGLEGYLNERGFALLRTQMGLSIAPMKDGETLSAEDYEKLDPEVKAGYEAHRRELQEQFDKTMRQTRELDRQGRKAMENINNELSGFVVDNLMSDIVEQFKDCSKVQAYLDTVRKDIVDNASHFVQDPAQQQQQVAGAMFQRDGRQWMSRYQVNVLADTCDDQCAPVIIEDSPTYYRLIGRIEHRSEFGAMVTDFTQIRAGALHRANGGYLVVEAKSLLANPLAWDGLKRALQNQEIRIEEMAQYYGLVATVSLEPEPIPLDVKVVLIGDEQVYHMLYAYDDDFRELFKVKAEFVSSITRNEDNAREYAGFIATLCEREGLHHLSGGAVGQVIEYASRASGDQQKVTTRFADIADLVREASYWGERAGREIVAAEDVRRAIEERRYRLNHVAERYLERITEGVVRVDTSGETVGQVNGLSVMQIANYQFGMPSRISCNTFVGRSGVVSIDREVKMSGPIHDKGQLILSSYLSSRFAQKRGMSVSISLTFEQLYSGVDGDSASSTELYAILSSLSGVPIKQNLAVTGSVDQFGRVQAIGGVNSKIEGFFQVCQANGLTGDQGVLIPTSNVRHLMLREEVVEAIDRGEFHIYAVSTIEQGIELLTGVPAGEPDENGEYPEDSIYARVAAKLEAYAEQPKDDAGNNQEDETEAEGAFEKPTGAPATGDEPEPSEDEPEEEKDEDAPEQG